MRKTMTGMAVAVLFSFAALYVAFLSPYVELC